MTTSTVTIRPATTADRPALEHLAALDSQHLPAGDLLVAEVAGELRAAVPVEGGKAIADPFHLTRDVVALLSERVAQLGIRGGQRQAGLRLHAARA